MPPTENVTFEVGDDVVDDDVLVVLCRIVSDLGSLKSNLQLRNYILVFVSIRFTTRVVSVLQLSPKYPAKHWHKTVS